MSRPPRPQPPSQPRRGRLRWALEHGWPIAAAGLLGLVGAVAFVESGLYDVAASHPHTTLTYWITHTTMERSVRRAAGGIAAPAAFSPAQRLEGFRLYDQH